MKIARLKCYCADDIEAIGKIILNPEVFKYLHLQFLSLSGIVNLVDRIRCDAVYALAAIDDTGNVFGLMWGSEFETGVLNVHHAFLRHSKVNEAIKLGLEKCTEDTGISRFCGIIPDTNRPCKLAVIRAGFRECGLRRDLIFTDAKGNKAPCREYRMG